MTLEISIHALREEGDPGPCPCEYARIRFLSTPSARRATSLVRLYCSIRSDFYPRPPRGGRRVQLVENIVDSEFLSTPSARRATRRRPRQRPVGRISIHALREEGDRVRFLRSSQRHNFYPRPPRGGRHARVW